MYRKEPRKPPWVDLAARDVQGVQTELCWKESPVLLLMWGVKKRKDDSNIRNVCQMTHISRNFSSKVSNLFNYHYGLQKRIHEQLEPSQAQNFPTLVGENSFNSVTLVKGMGLGNGDSSAFFM